MTEQRQEFRKLPKPTGRGKDDCGDFEVIPLAMVRGGKTKPFKVYTEPTRHLILDQNIPPRGWYKSKHEPSSKRPRPCYSEATLTTPYGGFCWIDCAACYINNGTRGYRATGIPTVDPSYAKKMEKRIAGMMISGAFYITSFTEPFHRLEPKYHVTEWLTDVLVKEGLPIFYLSRQLVPGWAVDALLENPYSYMQWSINTSNPDHWRRFSPGAPDLDEMYEQIDNLSSRGIYVSIQCNPIMAGITTLDEIVDLVWDLSEVGAHHIIFKFVEQVCNNRKVIVERMHQRKLPHVDVFDNLFSQVIGGVYTIQEDVRIEWLDVLLEETRCAGLTMSLCYEYFDDGGAGANLAPFYTTSDQCHGRGIPMYFRPEPGAPFEPLPGCYRKGCLFCEEYGTHACNHGRMLEAGALKYKDLRSIKLIGCDAYWNIADHCVRPAGASAYLGVPMGNPGLMTDAEMWGWELESL